MLYQLLLQTLFDLVNSSSRSMGQGLFQGNGELRKVRDNSRQCTSDTLVTAQLELAGHIGPARPDAAAQSVAAVQDCRQSTQRGRGLVNQRLRVRIWNKNSGQLLSNTCVTSGGCYCTPL